MMVDKVSTDELLKKYHFLSVNQLKAQHIMNETLKIIQKDNVPMLKDRMVRKEKPYPTRSVKEAKRIERKCKKSKLDGFPIN